MTRVDGPRRRGRGHGARRATCRRRRSTSASARCRTTRRSRPPPSVSCRTTARCSPASATRGSTSNLGVFDLLGVPPADNNTPDSTAGFNVHSIAIEVPIASLTQQRIAARRPPATANAVIGVWSTASRPSVTSARRRAGAALEPAACRSRGSVSRSSTRSSSRAARRTRSTRSSRRRMRAALPFVLDPEVPKLLSAALRHPVARRAARRPRDDLPDGHSRAESAART